MRNRIIVTIGITLAILGIMFLKNANVKQEKPEAQATVITNMTQTEQATFTTVEKSDTPTPATSDTPTPATTPKPTKCPSQSSMNQGNVPVGGGVQTRETPETPAGDPSQGHHDPSLVVPTATPSNPFEAPKTTNAIVITSAAAEEETSGFELPMGTPEGYEVEAYFDEEAEEFYLEEYLIWAKYVDTYKKVIGGDHIIIAYQIEVGSNMVTLDLTKDVIKVEKDGTKYVISTEINKYANYSIHGSFFESTVSKDLILLLDDILNELIVES